MDKVEQQLAQEHAEEQFEKLSATSEEDLEQMYQDYLRQTSDEKDKVYS